MAAEAKTPALQMHHYRSATETAGPAIYSQRQRLSQGSTASWGSPDVQTNWWDDWRFMDSIMVRVQNASSEASAVNTLVQVRWAPFGIGRSPGMQFAVVNASAATETIVE